MKTPHRYNLPLNLGMAVAEEDWVLLHSDFISLPVFQNVVNFGPAIIIGRKGSGKSALRLQFEKNLPKNIRAITITPKVNDLSGVFENIVEINKTGLIVESIIQAWKLSALSGVFNSILSNSHHRNISRIKSDIPSTLIEKIADDKNFSPKDAAKLISNWTVAGLDVDRVISALKRKIEEFGDLENIKYYILIDSVDEAIHNYADTSARADLFSTFYEALISFFREFSEQGNTPFGRSIAIKLFIPLDFYRWAAGRHDDRLVDYKRPVNWDRVQLEEFATRRLAHNLDRKDQHRINQATNGKERRLAIWNHFYPETFPMEGYHGRRSQTLDYPISDLFIDHTFRRPRDLLVLLKAVDDIRHSQGATFPDREVIASALEENSRSLAARVSQEYKSALPRLDRIMEALVGSTGVISMNQILNIVEKVVGQDALAVQKALETLYQACVIGVVRRNASVDGSVVRTFGVFYYEFPDYLAIRDSDRVVLHPGLWHALRIVPVGMAISKGF